MVDGFWEGGDGDGMDFEVDTEGQVTSKDAVPSGQGGGKQINKDGKYHSVVLAIKKEPPKSKDNAKDGECPFNSPFINITFEVLAGGPADKNTHDDQVGLKLYHKIFLWKWNSESQKFEVRRGKELKFISQIAYGLGIISKEQLDSGRFALNFANLDGRQCVIEARDEPYDVEEDGKKITKHSFRLPFGNCWRPDDPEVANVKKDPDAMAIYLSGDGALETASPNLF